MMLILLVLVLLALVGGGLGHSRAGLKGWSPAAILILIIVVLALSGRL